MALEAATYLDELNGQQRAAVEYIDGPQLVIAGAGSGKTRVLTYKVMHLLAHGYEPWRILALTFTNKAAREMRSRITAKVGFDAAKRIWMGTFHSIFARILRSHADRLGYPSNFTIYDAQDAKNLIKTIIKQLNLDEKSYKLSTIAGVISTAKNNLVSPEMYMADRERSLMDSKLSRPQTGIIYQAYRDRLKTAGAMDFDDLLYNMSVLLAENPDIANHYREFFRYILVDEYQDTNYAQHRIITQLTDRNPRLCVVGDDAQSIYSFRGAVIANILGLERTFPTLKLFKLEQNYRSTQNIINAANSLISHNTQQIPKNIFSDKGDGFRVEVVQCYSDFEEAGLLAMRIAEQKARTGDPYEEFAVLYRTNSQSRVLEESLRKRNIPYRIYGGLSFFQRKEVKDAVAYLRLTLNHNDEEALKRIINVPARKIGETTLSKVIKTATAYNVSLFSVLEDMDTYPVDLNKPTRKRLEDFAEFIRRCSAFAGGHNAVETLEYILLHSGMWDMYTTDYVPENISKHENLVEFVNYAAQFVESKLEQGLEDETGLSTFMAEVSLSTDLDKNANDETDSDCVTLMTIHAAKGLEFSNVFVVGVERNLLPSLMASGSEREIEEERRLLYVAITRAKRFCMLSFAMSRYINGASTTTGPSPFLSEIDPGYIKLAPGTNIRSAATMQQRPASYGSQMLNRVKMSMPTPARPSTPSPAAPVRVASIPGGASPTLHTAGELHPGMGIFHPRFSQGIIKEVDAAHPMGARITVEFSEEGEKTLLLKFAKFVITDN